jgi:hypothetical protein
VSEMHEWVPDGDPCPRHPKEISRLIHVQGVGFYSQCRRCIDDFFTWRWANMNQKSEVLLVPKGEPPQLRLIGDT